MSFSEWDNGNDPGSTNEEWEDDNIYHEGGRSPADDGDQDESKSRSREDLILISINPWPAFSAY